MDDLPSKLAAVRRDYSQYHKTTFTPFLSHAFVLRLPAGTREELLIALHPRDGQTIAALRSWMEQTDIAGSDLLPFIQEHRLGGAHCHALAAAEAEALLLPEGALYCLLRRTRIEVPGMGLQPVFGPGRPLIIYGHLSAQPPESVTLLH